ncbi:MAG: hypothetical protein Q9195_007267 [Heterodermia aff. obscurata]
MTALRKKLWAKVSQDHRYVLRKDPGPHSQAINGLIVSLDTDQRISVYSPVHVQYNSSVRNPEDVTNIKKRADNYGIEDREVGYDIDYSSDEDEYD